MKNHVGEVGFLNMRRRIQRQINKACWNRLFLVRPSLSDKGRIIIEICRHFGVLAFWRAKAGQKQWQKLKQQQSRMMTGSNDESSK